MNKKIISLIKIFLKGYESYFTKFKKKKKRGIRGKITLNMIIVITIAYISYQLIKFLNMVEVPKIFLSLYFIILAIVLTYKNIFILTNMLFFSKDLEYILPMPIKSEEIFIARYITILIFNYKTEFLFGYIPLVIYGLLKVPFSLLYFIFMPIVLVLFPMLIITVISLFNIIMMKFFKIIKNENIFQTIVTTISICIVINLEFSTIGVKISEPNNLTEYTRVSQEQAYDIYKERGKKYLIVNPSVEILSGPKEIGNVLKNFIKLILYNGTGLIIVLVISKKIYLKYILMGTAIKKNKKKILKNEKKIFRYKSNSQVKTYISKEIKMLFRAPSIFMQMIFPVILILLTIIAICSMLIPYLEGFVNNNQTVKESLSQVNFNSEMLCVILCVLQVFFSISNISLTAISRDKGNIVYMKSMPISLYRQFIYKNIIQVALNFIVSIIILGMVHLYFSKISIIQLLLIFIISIFLNLENSFAMLIIDLRKPILKWNSEYEITKNNPNKIFQYVYTIIIILILMYFSNIFKTFQVNNAILIQVTIFAIEFLGMNIYIYKNINKIFNKIN